MPRTPDGLVARDKRLSVRVTDEDLTNLDLARGGIERADFIRELIGRAAALVHAKRRAEGS